MTRTKQAGVAGILALTLALAAAPAVRAADTESTLGEGRPLTTALGRDSSALTYWVKAADGWHVVTTVDSVSRRGSAAENHAVVRFSAVLLPGQSQVISVPALAGKRQQLLRIRRDGDRIEVMRILAPPA